MILTVTLNVAVDKTYRVEGFALDRVHRPSEWRIVAGGKGINVARVYQTLGGRAVAAGFLGGLNGRFIGRALEEEGIPARFVETREESRVCIAVVDPRNRTQTEINEAGPLILPEETAKLKALFERLIRESSFYAVALSGSTPPGVEPGIYAELIGIARSAGVRTALDASGDCLAEGLKAAPWMVKPNIHELAWLCGRELADQASIADAARGLVGTCAEAVAVTLGGDGAVLVTGSGAWCARPPRVEFVSAVGSGDSFLAAFVWASEAGLPPEEALRLGVAAGTANTTVYGAGFCTKEAIEGTARAVDVEPLDTVGR